MLSRIFTSHDVEGRGGRREKKLEEEGKRDDRRKWKQKESHEWE
jgi:hypothetical protein